MESPTRLGINIGPNAYYSDRQMVARPLAHGAFNSGIQVGFIRVGYARGNTFQDERFHEDDPATAYRTSFRGGMYHIATGRNAGGAGVITEHDIDSGLFSTGDDGISSNFSDGPSVAKGDYVWLRGPATSHAIPNPMPGERELGIGDFRIESSAGAEVAFVPVEDSRFHQAVQLHIDEKDAYAAIKHYLIALPSSRYHVRVRARSETGNGQLGVRLTNLGIPSGQPGHRIFLNSDDISLGKSWKTFEFTGETFADKRIRDEFSMIDVRVSGARPDQKVTALIDSIELVDESIDSGFAFNQRLVETLTEAKIGVLRFYGIAGAGSLVRNITAARAEQSGWTFTDGPDGFQRHTTHAVVDDWMMLCKQTGAVPWITLGGANTPGDWSQLISYLAAPEHQDEMADQRAEHGYSEPWTDSFDTVYLELGNEWWNSIFAPYSIQEPELYGELCNTIFQRVLTHPHFDPKKFQLVVGGWAVNAHNWNLRLDRASKHHDMISVAPYLAHALDTADYGAPFADVEGSFENGGRATVDGLSDSRLAIYELNTHTTSGAAPASDISGMATSLGAGIAVLDQAMASMSEWGATPINYFTYFQRGYGSGDRERRGLWGNLVLARDGTHRPRPVWQGLRLANRHVIDGNMVDVQVQGGTSWNQTKNGSVPNMKSLPHLKAYAFMPDYRSANVLLINRHLTDSLHIHVQLPFTPKSEVTRVQLNSSAIGNHNEDYERVTLIEDDFSWTDVDGKIDLPPHSATALQFMAAE